jgi:hypothetical protein
MKLIACLGTGKGTWSIVSKLVNEGQWEKVYFITNDFGKEKFTSAKGEFIVINTNKDIEELRDEIITKLKDELKEDMEVAVNIISGEGKEHIALLSALLKCGVGIKFIITTKEGNKEI